jgi:imidazolonepropionase-like amidohydrolase
MSFIPTPERLEQYPNFLYDPRQAHAIPKKYRPEAHSPEADVERVASGGGICVKAFYEPGFAEFTGVLPAPTEDTLEGVREAAHRHKLPFLLHANSIDSHRLAAKVKPDVVVHGMWNWRAQVGTEMPVSVREVLDAERQANIGMMPTSRVIGGLVDLMDTRFLDDPQLHVLPDQLLAWYKAEAGQWFARDTKQSVKSNDARAVVVGIQQQGQRAAKYFADSGGHIFFGSDTPSAPTYANPPGYNGYLELRELEAAGLSPRLLLTAATTENARWFALNDYGTIEPGKIANLLLLRDNPLASTRAFDTIEIVIVGGRVVPRAILSANAQ